MIDALLIWAGLCLGILLLVKGGDTGEDDALADQEFADAHARRLAMIDGERP